jgi:hypothetical protein
MWSLLFGLVTVVLLGSELGRRVELKQAAKQNAEGV